MKIDYVNIGNQVKQHRKMINMSQEELAEEAEITAKHVSGIENGRTKLSLECLINIANAMGTTPNDLLSDFIRIQQPVVEGQWQDLIRGCTIEEQKKFLKFFRAFIAIERG